MYIKKAENAQEENYTPTHAFSDFMIADALKQNILRKGYVIPTPIQDQAIVPILQYRDVIGLANTGTGKTAAFLIPLINKAYFDRSQKVLIIAPTRELAVQIEEECRAFTKGLHVFSVLLIGGVGMMHQIRQLQKDHDIVIATPGRLRDLERKGKIKLERYNNIVLDEVDRMMDMGFINDVKAIISGLPTKRQSLFFSATMPAEIKNLAFSFLTDPIMISVKSQDMAKSVEQDVVRLQGRQKVDVLTDLLHQEGFEKVLVFGRTKWGMEKLAKILTKRGFKVAAIHGNKNQNQRQRALNDFKNGQISVLLATDVASRGLDIDDVTHVINFDEPASYEDYINRIGRTGRANKSGVALTLIN
jgi:superfamily II DNA/RNA helicase